MPKTKRRVVGVGVGAALVAAAILLGRAPASGVGAAAAAQGAARAKFAAFVVSESNGEPQVEPVAFFDARGAFEEPVSAGAEESAASAFFEHYYRPGAKYRLIYGGAEAGTVTIRAALRAECAPMAARAELSLTSRLSGSGMALATDATRALRPSVSRRAPTPRERAAALRLAKSVLLGKRVPAASVNRNTAALDLAATDLDGDGREELVGSFLVRSGARARDVLFLAAAPRGDGYAALIQNHVRLNAREMMDPSLIGEVGKGGFLTETFVEHFDADGDGVGELFTAAASFEGTTYKVYRRGRGAWRAVYEHYGYRCAF